MGESRVDVSSLDNIYSTTEPIVIKSRENGKHIYREKYRRANPKISKPKSYEGENNKQHMLPEENQTKNNREEKIQQKQCVGHWSITSIVCTL
jgi:hypothetical protein